MALVQRKKQKSSQIRNPVGCIYYTSKYIIMNVTESYKTNLRERKEIGTVRWYIQLNEGTRASEASK